MQTLYEKLIVFGNMMAGLFFRLLVVLRREGVKGTSVILRNRLIQNSIVQNVLKIQNDEDTAPTVSIIIPVFNALVLTRECIYSLSHDIHGIKHEILVMDNASNDGTPNWLNEEGKNNPSLKVFTMEKNIGFGPAVNYGLRQSKGEYIVILNNDTIVAHGWLKHLVDALEKDLSIGVISPVTNYVGEGPQIDQDAKDIPADIESIDRYAEVIADRSDVIYEPNRLVFFCVMLRRELIDLVGELDEGYEKGNFEDDDYCLRVRMAGYRLAIARNAFVYHHGSKTFKLNRISHSQHMEKNRVRFYKKAGRIATSTRRFLPVGLEKRDTVSVILRTKDRPLLLRRALTSLANQTFRDFEVVLVNDGGEDVSSLVHSFAAQFSIKYISNEVSNGRTAAVNSGFQNSTGKWISYLDDDDILYPWHLETLFQSAESSKFKFIYSDCNRALFLDENKITPQILMGATPWEYSRKELLIQNYIPIHTWLYARECAEKIGLWDESLDRLEDYEFLLRLSADYPFYHIKKVTCEYRYYVNSANSIYTDRYRTLTAYKKIYQRNPVDDFSTHVRRQEVLNMINAQIREIEEIKGNIGVNISREEAVRNIIRLVAGI